MNDKNKVELVKENTLLKTEIGRLRELLEKERSPVWKRVKQGIDGLVGGLFGNLDKRHI